MSIVRSVTPDNSHENIESLATIEAALMERNGKLKEDALILHRIIHEDPRSSASYNTQRAVRHCPGCGANGGYISRTEGPHD